VNLIAAIKAGDLTVIKSIKPETFKGDDRMAMYAAIDSGSLDVVKMLIDNGFDWDEHHIMYAMQEKKEDICDFFVELTEQEEPLCQ
jgi:hypothetical protein